MFLKGLEKNILRSMPSHYTDDDREQAVIDMIRELI
jgi:hypothetical protein